ncbi:hypothetical protein HF325_002426 [Metschnikowia pulcherrima]|uniref:LisH domain-containing protein n=1 Tax=Metschnikowia pulcherrima TaxID=27326 RepID=A0A8H7GV22_9ASCO|nr:hypothetical protein HF325_002426 [Metschnikowia pulcherrima]
MSVHSFVAQFLKENGYLETLRTFEAEYGKVIPLELPHDETLEGILNDRLKYLAIDAQNEPEFEEVLSKDLKNIKDTQLKPWLAPYPKNRQDLGPVSELAVDCAILSRNGANFALLATSGKSLIVVDLGTGKEIARVNSVIGNVVVRRIIVAENLVFLCGMNGKVTIGKLAEDFENFEVLSETQIHQRLVTDMKVITFRGKLHLISIGWDFLVKGSCFDAVVYHDKLYVLVCKKEITLMDVLCLDKQELVLDCRVALNDAEFSASGFTPMSIKIHHQPDSVPLIAVGTSHEPHMRVIILLMQNVGQNDKMMILRNQILCNLSTLSPQDKYSDAQIQWRFDGSGVWIIGDDGVIRGLDLVNKSVVTLHGHEGRVKCVSFFEDKLVSCGTDRNVIEWT